MTSTATKPDLVPVESRVDLRVPRRPTSGLKILGPKSQDLAAVAFGAGKGEINRGYTN